MNLRSTGSLGYKRRRSLGTRRAARQPVSSSTCKSIFLSCAPTAKRRAPSLLAGTQKAGHTALSPRHRQLPGARRKDKGPTAPAAPWDARCARVGRRCRTLRRENGQQLSCSVSPRGRHQKGTKAPKKPKQLSPSVREDEQLLLRPALSPRPAGHPGQRHCLSPGG